MVKIWVEYKNRKMNYSPAVNKGMIDKVITLPCDIAHLPDAFVARKIPVLVYVCFADNNGTLQTLDGQVAYHKGDALLTGVEGECWPVSRKRFDATYQATEHAGVFQERVASAWCWIAPESLDVALSECRARLHAEQGDVIVQYAPGDQYVVAARIFPQIFERV